MRRGSSRILKDNLPSVRAPSMMRIRGVSSQSKRAPPVSGILEKCDKLNPPKTSRLDILKTKTAFSTKKEINDYIKSQVEEVERDIAARKIQDFWNETRKNKKKKKHIDTSIIIKLSMTDDEKRAYIENWRDYTEECIIRKKVPSVDAALIYREKFGCLFWTFQILRRNAVMNRHPKFLLAVCNTFYIPEWSFYKSNLEAEKKQKTKMITLRKKIMTKRVFAALHNHVVLMKQKKTNDQLQKEINFYYMKKALKVLKNQRLIGIFNTHKLKRVCFHWYSYIDKVRMLRAAMSIFKQRADLKSLRTSLNAWEKGSLAYGVLDTYVFDKVNNNKLKLLPYIYLLKGDFEAFTFVSSFSLWNKMLKNRVAAHSFVHFALKESKKATLKRFIFDCFRAYASDKYQTNAYSPFAISELEKTKKTPVKPSQLFRMTQKIEFTGFDVYTSNADDIRQNYLTKLSPVPTIENLSSEEARTVFYHLIVLFSQKYQEIRMESYKRSSSDVEEWKKSNNIETLLDLANISRYQDCVANCESRAARKRESRNKMIRAKHVAHDTALELARVLPKFAVTNGITLDKTETIVTEAVSPKEASNAVVLSIKLPPEDPPFLMPIETLAEQFRENQRMFRRAPKDAFPSFAEDQTQKTQKTMIDSSSSINTFSRESSSYQTCKSFFTTEVFAKKIDGMKLVFKELQNAFTQRRASNTLLEQLQNKSAKVRSNSTKVAPKLLDLLNSKENLNAGDSIFLTSDGAIKETEEENISLLKSSNTSLRMNSQAIILSSVKNNPIIPLVTELSSLALGFSGLTGPFTAVNGVSFLTRRCIMLFDALINEGSMKVQTIDAALKRIITFITGSKARTIPKIATRKALYRDDLLHELLEKDSCAGSTPNFLKEMLTCIGQMSSLMEALPEEECKDDFPMKEFQAFAREKVAKLSSIKKKSYSLRTKIELEEPKPTDYDARFFGFVSMFFLHPSIVDKLLIQ